MANWSRALLNLGAGIGDVAQNVAQKERDAALAMREENLMRLNASLRQQADDRQFGQQKELVGMEHQMAQERTGQAQAFEVGMAERGAQHDLKLMERREQHDLTMQDRDAAMRREQMGAESALYEKRAGREDLESAQRSYAAQFEAVDERLAELNDQMIKARTEAQTQGTELDPALLQPWQDEIKQLQQQKRQIGKQRDIHLAQLGDPRYKKLSPQEVEEERKVASGMQRSTPRTNRYAGGPRAEQQEAVAAQAPTPKKGDVPAPPPKPKGMMEREQRKARKVAPGGAQLGPMGAALLKGARGIARDVTKGFGGGKGSELSGLSTAELKSRLKTATGVEATRIRTELEKRQR